ncbi:COG3650 family protein [Legionella israelensis]|uniref:Uncharacterized protein n=1 Tax=Legionella israelensis TaxID=454 RepID=A0A0W0VGE0_9GAMM|nr:hypothetical protein [Legionella israelensis]KTD19200.1 hypothetical protein Lisr_2110 [Legionella israelensis]QBS10411.1 hypothetical protein E4T55_11395 [Legionella israelensis]SCY56229.1 hypothetical protein SAMN02746069_02870 [Legionella israelensis DSM 19235]STX60027.1 Predicted membrane protein [Legionella israelensis]
MQTYLSKLKIIMLCMLFSLTSYANGGDSPPIDPNNIKMKCFGTEPFWSFTMSKEEFVYETPEIKKTPYKSVKPRLAQGLPTGFLMVFETHALKKTKNKATLVAKKNPAGCSDGMSDKSYPYDAVLILHDRVLSGCCDNQ